MTITGYDDIFTPPVTVGDYLVNIDFVAADDYMLPDTLPTPVLHITHASGEAGVEIGGFGDRRGRKDSAKGNGSEEPGAGEKQAAYAPGVGGKVGNITFPRD